MYPAGLADLRVRCITLPSLMRVRVVEAGAPEAPPVLFLHGWGASLYTFRRLIPAVAAAGWRAVAVDLKGHGLSDKPTARGQFSRARMLAHVTEIMDALALRRASIAGHSLGGGLAIELARAVPERVERLALFSPIGFCPVRFLTALRLGSPAAVRRLLPYAVPRVLVAMLLRRVYGSAARPTELDIDEYWAPSGFHGFAIAVRDLLHEYDWSPYAAETLGRIATPTLVVMGAEDRMFDPATVECRARAIPHVRVRVLEGVGHVTPEEMPAPATEDLLAFLSGR